MSKKENLKKEIKKIIKETYFKESLNESYYCNGAGQNASSHPGCREHGAACINWGEGVAGTMGQNVNDPDDWQCVPNELNVGTGGTGGGPLSGDDLVVKTKGGTRKPNKGKQLAKLAARNMVRETDQDQFKTTGGGDKPSMDRMMRESATNLFCEREGQDDGEVTTFRITSIGKNGEKGESSKANRNHKVIRNLDITNATKVRQLTKGQDSSQEDRLNEGPLCCWFRGGCCGWEKNLPDPHTSWNPEDKRYEQWAGYVIEWNACCGNSSKGGCC
tara:strand:+ start:666 stop:1487 length:822 start_codon:yes stop_codon:yes gene_type:complete